MTIASGITTAPGSPIREVQSVGEALTRSHHAIHAVRHLEEQMLHSQRVSLLGVFAGGLAHDVNNQLTIILAALNDIRASRGTAEHATERLKEAEDACWRCVEITRGLVSLGKPGQVSFRKVQLNELVQETAALVRHVLRPGTNLRLDLADGLPDISADPVQEQQALLNLALNARDAMPQGGLLEFRTSKRGGGVELSVHDTGTGMSPEVRARIFEPFFTCRLPKFDLGCSRRRRP